MSRRKTERAGWLLPSMLSLLVYAILAVPARGQVVATGAIDVVVEDESGGRLPGVVVGAQSTDSVSRREVVTDAHGRATLPALQPSAQYVVTAALKGFSTARRERILVRSGQVTTLCKGEAPLSVLEDERCTNVSWR